MKVDAVWAWGTKISELYLRVLQEHGNLHSGSSRRSEVHKFVKSGWLFTSLAPHSEGFLIPPEAPSSLTPGGSFKFVAKSLDQAR